MVLEARREPKIVPKYSLTGDLLSYKRCGLQYRYQNGSQLPPSRPVQLWFGEFIHGVMEASYRLWQETKFDLNAPWPCNVTPWEKRKKPDQARQKNDIAVIGEAIETALTTQGKYPRNQDVRVSAYRRAEAAVNLIGKHLFPLVTVAEEPLSGARLIKDSTQLRADRYELTGVVDVLSHVTVNNCPADNIFRRALEAACHALPPEYEVVVDYKGAPRPRTDESYWEQGEWQVRTYAWLRNRREPPAKVVAGILIYINELAPSASDLQDIKAAVRAGKTDVVPTDINDKNSLERWTSGYSTDGVLSQEYRLRRAIRVIPTTPDTIGIATEAFDGIVKEIESRISEEANSGRINDIWLPTSTDEQTCVACDFKSFCPKPAGQTKVQSPSAPDAP